ncbi:Alpha/Beta hydrolase protein [Aspergillus navahoensis]
MLATVAFLWGAVGLCAAFPASGYRAGPEIDLGYEIHRATVSNDTPAIYSFLNIRYAAPPLDRLRFAPPAAPTTNRSAVRDGADDVICPQASPAWLDTAVEFIQGASFANVTPIDYSKAAVSALTPGTTEDCLFLDVRVPEAVFNARGTGKGAAVVVWIHGGGYIQGYKSQEGSGRGLILASEQYNETGIVYVAINYRLGLFGWSSGPTFEAQGQANLGLLDQRFALDWIQKHIHLFGGDPARVTVLAESAGAGSVLAHLTSHAGGRGPLPFSKAILQSPWMLPFPDRSQQEDLFQSVLRAANVTSFVALQRASSQALIEANNVVGTRASYGTFAFGPVIDGDTGYLPGPPAVLLQEGRFHSSVQLMVSYNLNEGILFASPFVTDSSAFEAFITDLFPKGLSSTFDRIATTLYPPPPSTPTTNRAADANSTAAYATQPERVAAAYGDLVIRCNAMYLLNAYPGNSYAYRFGVPPGWHSNDEPYTFYEADSSSSSKLDPNVAQPLQGYLTHFAVHGDPNAVGLPLFRPYDRTTATVQELDRTYIGPLKSDISAAVCKQWLEAGNARSHRLG